MIIDFLRRHPLLKKIIKCIYILNAQFLSIFYIEKNRKILIKKCFKHSNAFFGYYDNVPVNESNKFLVAHTTHQDTKKDFEDILSVDISLKNLVTGEEITVDKSSAFNWQIGTRLQWLNDNQFIYNFVNDNLLVSKIFNTKTNSFKIIKFPIFDCFKDLFAIGLDFKTLYINNREYGYNLKDNLKCSAKSNQIYLYNFKNDSIKYLISTERINKILGVSDINGFFNHIMISPDGKNFVFIYRYFDKNKVRNDFLFLYKINQDNLKLIVDSGYVSHMMWFDNKTLIGYYRNKNNCNAFNLIKIEPKVEEEVLLNTKSDGHPHKFDNEHIIFDSYPNYYRHKNLYLMNIKSKKLKLISKFYESIKFRGSYRCDLHPRVFNGIIYIDSVHEGKRNIYSIDNFPR